jgi:hypothetical protein
MPKKPATTRSGAQRNRPRVQKSVELVRKPSEQQEAPEPENLVEPTTYNVSTATEDVPAAQSTSAESTSSGKTSRRRAVSEAARESTASTLAQSTASTTTTTESTVPKGSASARLAARRQAAQKTQQRTAVSLITAEHYSYVRKDLIFIAILAAIMFSAIIILYFVPGIGS